MKTLYRTFSCSSMSVITSSLVRTGLTIQNAVSSTLSLTLAHCWQHFNNHWHFSNRYTKAFNNRLEPAEIYRQPCYQQQQYACACVEKT